MKTRFVLLALGAFAMMAAGPAFSYERSFTVGSSYHQFNTGPDMSTGHRYTPTAYWSGPDSIITLEDLGGTQTRLKRWLFHNQLNTTFDAGGTTGAPPNTTFAYVDIDGATELTTQPVAPTPMTSGSVSFGSVGNFASITTGPYKGMYCESQPPTSVSGWPTSCPAGAGLIDGAWTWGPTLIPVQDFGPITIAPSQQSYSVSACPNPGGAAGEFVDCYYSYITLSGQNWGRHENINGEQILTPTPMLAPLLALGGLGGSLAYMGGRVLRRRNED